MSELIEKQAVIDALLAKMDTIDDKPEVVLGMAVAAGMIKDMPPVTPAEKVGYWTKDVNDARELFDTVRYYCSACGDGQGHGHCKYCPNCGAKMISPISCSTCILDRTDACTRGAGRAVDDEACEDYLASPTGAGSEE